MHLATADGMKEVPFPGSIQCLSFASSSQLTHSSTKLSCRRWCLNRVLQEELAKTNGSCFRQKGWCKWRQRDGKLYAMWKEDEGYCVLWSIKCVENEAGEVEQDQSKETNATLNTTFTYRQWGAVRVPPGRVLKHVLHRWSFLQLQGKRIQGTWNVRIVMQIAR